MRVLFTGLVLACAVTACGGETESPDAASVSPPWVGPPIEATLGQDFTVSLKANPTTGYRWQFMPAEDPIVEPVGEPEFHLAETEPPHVVGGGGSEVWTFRPLRQGQQVIRMEYRRPWEDSGSAATVATYEVTVK